MYEPCCLRPDAAKQHYEELKKQTQAELKQTLDQFLAGDGKVTDRAAPRIMTGGGYTPGSGPSNS